MLSGRLLPPPHPALRLRSGVGQEQGGFEPYGWVFWTDELSDNNTQRGSFYV